ncbi:mechanosensitive ion channel domain-containing protein [Pantoea anthophila]|uniref:mechanosensitive ion channel domain-containing protein n=1 Tax=Pantoea anthophila TaxID=470931 RepID=UPI0028A1B478|nr:mechanosensitive ion channel domain-containing protein [Pantoea anthophila]
MQDTGMIDEINNAGNWIIRNQELLISYAVNIVAAIAIIVVGLMIARIIANAVNRLLRARHIDTTVAVGLALKDSLSNLAAGVLLVIFRHFRAGEFVDLGGIMGTVMNVQIFSTTLKSADGKLVVVPNGKIITGNIVNFSREPIRRNEFIIGVSYDADVDQVLTLLREVVDADSRVLQEKGVQVGLNELAASSMNFVVRCWSNSGDLQDVYWDLLKNFKRALDGKGIGIPYPQMDVHLHRVKKPETAAPETIVPQAQPE